MFANDNRQARATRGSPNRKPTVERRDRSADPSRGYFPRAVFFFGFGFCFFVLPVLPGAASFFGRFGDTGGPADTWEEIVERPESAENEAETDV